MGGVFRETEFSSIYCEYLVIIWANVGALAAVGSLEDFFTLKSFFELFFSLYFLKKSTESRSSRCAVAEGLGVVELPFPYTEIRIIIPAPAPNRQLMRRRMYRDFALI